MALSAAAMPAACAPATFTPLPDIAGVKVLSVTASAVQNFTADADVSMRYTHPSVTVSGLAFCNATATYTHAGAGGGDVVSVEVWLPAGADESSGTGWNGRLYAAGGSGLGAGRFLVPYTTMAGALAEGYAAVSSDAGLGYREEVLDGSWVLEEPGVLNLRLLQNFGAASLNEEAIIAKAMVESFYGQPPAYSYWNGCSQGGRQGMALAQRYPDAYDGIVVGAPGMNLPHIVSNMFWPQQFMAERGAWPPECETDAVVHAAIAACDELDGATDGIISEPYACLDAFNPFDHVGTEITCWPKGEKTKISSDAAAVVNATWTGITSSAGRAIWHGFAPGTNLTGRGEMQGAVAGTECSETGECTGRPNPLGPVWLKLFGAKDPDFEVGNLTRSEYMNLVRLSIEEQSSFFRTDSADLSLFQQAGGKLISWHGLVDDLLPPKATEEYYKQVSSMVPDVEGFYRHFEIPGLSHCFGGAGGQPTSMFGQLRAWVENGTAPLSSPVQYVGSDGDVWRRIICPYPQKVTPKDGCEDIKSEDCWKCT